MLVGLFLVCRMHMIVGAVVALAVSVIMNIRHLVVSVGMAVGVFVLVSVGMLVFVGVDGVAVSVLVAVVMSVFMLMGMMVFVLAFHGASFSMAMNFFLSLAGRESGPLA
jgi:hypothetical protein